jgi:acyl dehydratase
MTFDDLTVGQQLAPLSFPVTASAIIAGAIATNDFAKVHHDPAAAAASGVPSIFMNILTTNGLVQRFVTEWAGPLARVRKIGIRLGAPNFVGDTMILTGEVASVSPERREAEIAVKGMNGIGEHVSAKMVLAFEEAGR